MELYKSMMIAASGLDAQSGRIRIIAENLANAGSTGTTPGAAPYRRQIPTFKAVLDRDLGAQMVKTGKPIKDRSDFRLKFDPAHPAADQDGNVKLPNVNSLIETMDMREAMRAYEANLGVITSSRNIIQKTLDLLRR